MQRFLCFLIVCLLSVGTYSYSYARSSFDGNWAGATSQGESFTATVVDNTIDTFSVAFQFPDSCQLGRLPIDSNAVSAILGVDLVIPIEAGQVLFTSPPEFSQFGIEMSLNGLFQNGSANGTISIVSLASGSLGCDLTQAVGWSLTKEGGSGVMPLEFDVTKVWWDTQKPGQGIQILDSGTAVSGAWYLYDSSGAGMWVTFVGSPVNPLTADLYEFTGPRLGETWDPNVVSSTIVGQATFQFHSDESATLSYELHGVSSTLNLVPFSL